MLEPREGQTVDLAAAAEATVAALAPFALDRGVPLELAVAPDAARALGDADAVALAFQPRGERGAARGAPPGAGRGLGRPRP
jgi:hypothetical protein